MLTKITVGEILIPGQINWIEGPKFEYTESGPMLILAFKNPTQKEIEGARVGQIEMSFYEREEFIFICVKIENCGGWMDAPFSIRLYKNIEFDWSEEITDGAGLGITVVMLDANNGVVKSQRLIGASTQFSRELRKAILRQYEMPFDREKYFSKLNKVYAGLTSDDLAKRASFAFKIRR